MAPQNIFITGISSGIGKSAALFLASKGYNVYGSVRKIEDASFLTELTNVSIHPVILDVSKIDDINRISTELKDIPFAGLINNAGYALSGPLKYIDMTDFRNQFEINVFGLLAVTKAFLPNLEKNKSVQGEPGRIINISSISGKIVTPFTVPYSASKFAVESISDGMRREFAHIGIKVSIIEPGPIKTPIWDKAKSENTKAFVNEYEKMLLLREGFIDATVKNALPVEKVTKAIYHAISNPKPKIRYLIVKHPFLTRIIYTLPDRFIDYLAMKRVNLK